MSVVHLLHHSVARKTEPITVLVAEDHRRVREEMATQLEELGVHPLVAESGVEALRLATTDRPDLIFLDGLLPEMHGFEVARLVRAIDPDYHPHIAIATGIYKQMRYRNEARLKYGIDSYLTKPVSADQIAEVVQRCRERMNAGAEPNASAASELEAPVALESRNQPLSVVSMPSGDASRPGMTEGFYLSVLDQLSQGLFIVDHDRRITFWNRAAERLSGWSRTEVVGRSCADKLLNHCDENGQILCGEHCPLKTAMRDGKIRETDMYMLRKDGARVPVRVRSAPVRDARGVVTGCVETFDDSTIRLSMIDQLEKLRDDTLTDALTEVGNRRFIENRLDEISKAGVCGSVALLFIDLDHFKRINDEWGHDIGDEVLRIVSTTLRKSIRPFDDIGRWGERNSWSSLPISGRKRLARSRSDCAISSRDARFPICRRIARSRSRSERRSGCWENHALRPLPARTGSCTRASTTGEIA